MGYEINTPYLSLLLIKEENISDGINGCLLHLLAYKYRNIKDLQKHCALYIDEVALKAHVHYERKNDQIVGLMKSEHGRHVIPVKNALVVLVRSIAGGWKQPVSYHFTDGSCPSTEVREIVFNTIEKIAEISKFILLIY